MERKRLKKSQPTPLQRKPTKEELLARFKGRKRGPGKLSHATKDALLKAVALEGSDGRGKEGLVGYWRKIAREHPELTAKLLGKIMPLDVKMTELAAHIQMHNSSPVPSTPDEFLMTFFNVGMLKHLTTEELRTLQSALTKLRPPSITYTRLDRPNTFPSKVIDAELTEDDDYHDRDLN